MNGNERRQNTQVRETGRNSSRRPETNQQPEAGAATEVKQPQSSVYFSGGHGCFFCVMNIHQTFCLLLKLVKNLEFLSFGHFNVRFGGHF